MFCLFILLISGVKDTTLAQAKDEIVKVTDNGTGITYTMVIPPSTNDGLSTWDQTLIDPMKLAQLQKLLLSGKSKDVQQVKREPGWTTFYEGHIVDFIDGKTLKILFVRGSRDEKDQTVTRTQFILTENNSFTPLSLIIVDKNGKYFHCGNCPVRSGDDYNLPQKAFERLF